MSDTNGAAKHSSAWSAQAGAGAAAGNDSNVRRDHALFGKTGRTGSASIVASVALCTLREACAKAERAEVVVAVATIVDLIRQRKREDIVEQAVHRAVATHGAAVWASHSLVAALIENSVNCVRVAFASLVNACQRSYVNVAIGALEHSPLAERVSSLEAQDRADLASWANTVQPAIRDPLLVIAARHNDFASVSALLALGASVTVMGISHESAVAHAAKLGSVEALRAMLRSVRMPSEGWRRCASTSHSVSGAGHGASSVAGGCSDVPVAMACVLGPIGRDTKVLRAVLKALADAEATSSSCTGKEKECSVLRAKSHCSGTPLMAAAHIGCLTTLEMVYEMTVQLYDADAAREVLAGYDATGRSALHYACASGSSACGKFIVDKLSESARNPDGYSSGAGASAPASGVTPWADDAGTLLQAAATNIDALRFVVTLFDDDDGKAKLTAAANAKDERGATPLARACAHGTAACAKLLVDVGADPTAHLGTAVHADGLGVRLFEWERLLFGGDKLTGRESNPYRPDHAAAQDATKLYGESSPVLLSPLTLEQVASRLRVAASWNDSKLVTALVQAQPEACVAVTGDQPSPLLCAARHSAVESFVIMWRVYGDPVIGKDLEDVPRAGEAISILARLTHADCLELGCRLPLVAAAGAGCENLVRALQHAGATFESGVSVGGLTIDQLQWLVKPRAPASAVDAGVGTSGAAAAADGGRGVGAGCGDSVDDSEGSNLNVLNSTATFVGGIEAKGDVRAMKEWLRKQDFSCTPEQRHHTANIVMAAGGIRTPDDLDVFCEGDIRAVMALVKARVLIEGEQLGKLEAALRACVVETSSDSDS